MAMFDDLFDELPLPPCFRIAPLIDPLPLLSTFDRPSPLEPNAGVTANIDNETARLTGRRKALAEAKPLGEPESTDLRPLQKGSRSDLRSLPKSPRKKQKLYDHEKLADFVQLPKPQKKTKDDKPPPFEPVSAVNQLHEPPPSAGLFPPIETKATGTEDGSYLFLDEKTKLDAAHKPSGSVEERNVRDRRQNKPPAKRVCLRPYRMKWSEVETEQLVKGVAIYGVGKWKKILHHPEFSFQHGRTAVDLKDRCVSFHICLVSSYAYFPPRFRTCFPQKGHKTQSSQSTAGGEQSVTIPDTKATAPSSPTSNTHSSPSRSKKSNRASSSHVRKKAPKRPWTEAEDSALREGYRQHGFQWTQIAKDPSLHFNNRSGNQIRDRFRLKYAEIFDSGVKDPLPADGEKASKQPVALKMIETIQPAPEDLDPLTDSESSIDPIYDPDLLPHSKSAGHSAITTTTARPPPDITTLLNDANVDGRSEEDDFKAADIDDRNRLPDLTFGFADEGERWDENVTLPPLLLWEDMATRPIFELE